ncbi:hypothetical protein FE257_005846 [Aspergillus nanangensis]|uniref:Carrier domain-containing protein n=1 Tax=Aspergillus nanangensis TaxID=2582783 RepID=A0AAD4GV62_ASPNN|nr:hypothetical protein FE257_005846 [Aspergillus nanangensis]
MTLPVERFPFPPLLNEEDVVSEPSHERVPFPGGALKKDAAAFSILQAAWAIALKTFTGDGTICTASLLRRSEGNVKGMLVKARIEDAMAIADLIELLNDDARYDELDCDKLQAATLSCNSCLYLGRQSDNLEFLDLFDVSFLVMDVEDGYEMWLVYRTGHLAPAYASVVAATVSQILGEMLTDTCRALSTINLVHPHVSGQLLEWSSILPASVDYCVGPLFEQAVGMRPHSPAVDTTDLTLSYRELDRLSTRLARYLQMKGVVPESIVVLCFPKSAWAVVAMMAVIRAGGAILFLDPSHPQARRQEIIDQIDSRWILTAPEYGPLWDWFQGSVVFVDEAFLASLTSGDATISDNSINVLSNVRPNNALYVIFTSGSTGKPKGCVVEHRQFLTGSLAQQKASQMDDSDRVLQLASFTFDVSILEIITSLISGACVCIPNDQERAKGPAACIQQFGVTWAFLTPSLVKLMSPEMVPTLRFLVLGGEAVQQENIETWASHVRLANGYGPTECSIAATGNPRLSSNTSPANIGHPLGGCCWIVSKDDHNHLMPIGAPGELIIQGPIVARGYLNEPEKTQAVFLETVPWSPASPSSTSRLYKTGDVARFNVDGSLYFMGRKDGQVKLRGLRIELGEIEHRIAAHALVNQAAVILAKTGPCQGKLCAVVALNNYKQDSNIVELIADHDMNSASVELKTTEAALSEQLPSYMQPSIWAPVKAIPLTTSGKQNGVLVRQWVADMDMDIFKVIVGRKEGADGERVQPSNEREIALQDICSRILGCNLDDIWLNKSFIQNGGDSIQAMQLVDRLREKGMGAKIENILRSKTLLDLADSLTTCELIDPFNGTLTNIEPSADLIAQLGINSDEVEALYPISAVQRGILLAQQQSPDRYQLRITCEVLSPTGEALKPDLLHAAWAQVTRRHPALRTVFVDTEAEGGLCDQLVLNTSRSVVLERTYHDEQDLWQALDAYKRQDMPLKPQVDFIISSLGEDRVLCTIDISHALIDGVSVLILLRDLSLAYEGLLDVDTVVEYAPYIGHLQSLRGDDSLSYWKGRLEQSSPCHFPAMNDGTSEVNELHEVSLDIDSANEIHAFCANFNVTLATVFQAAWALVLRTYTGQDDVCYGYLTAGRDLPVPGISQAVGVFINMITYHYSFSASKTFSTLVEETQQAFLNGLPHQHCSLADIQHALGVNQPLFNTIMSLQSAVGETISGGRSDEMISFRVVRERDPTEYDLSINVLVSKSRLSVTLRYFTATLSDAAAMNVFETFKEAIDTVISHPDRSTSSFNGPSQHDRRQIATWNRNQWPDVHGCVHDFFQQQALERPQHVAVESWDGSFTYQELDSISTALARTLRINGVGPERLVPVCFSKSRWTVVAQLATLKAGGACVAFDPELPSARREEMVRQCDATVAVVSETNRSLFTGLVDKVVAVGPGCVDDGILYSPSTPNDALVGSSPEQAAFVVFTSGSTGKPKGIVLEHHAICSSARAHGPAMNYGPDARVLQFASYTFDVSIGETFTCLMSGGTLCIPHEEERLNDLARVINRMNVNVVYLTPSVASLLHPSQVPGVRTLALGGEAVRKENIATWGGALHLVNIYGPAECSVWSTGLTAVSSSASPRNVGYGLGARMWITHPEDPSQLCAVGTVGELLIEGPIVARGYLKDPAKTTAAFIPPPGWLSDFDTDASQSLIKLYRTGDLVRYNHDGTIHFIGRRDHQVKLHGQRVEMGEIEHALLSEHSVQNALALVPQSGPYRGRLVAVVEYKSRSAPSVQVSGTMEMAEMDDENLLLAQVKQHVSNILPGYMVPTGWLTVQTIPVTRNGKSDRSLVGAWVEALPVDVHELGKESHAENEMERELQLVIASVLNLPVAQVCFDQSFLALGGDSITAMQVVSRSRPQGIQVAVKSILKSKTIRQIAEQACMKPLAPAENAALALTRPFALMRGLDVTELDTFAVKAGYPGVAAFDDAYPCSPMQEGILISQAQSPETYRFHAVCAVRSTNGAEPVRLSLVQRAWERVVARHPALRTFFVEGLSPDGLYGQVVVQKHEPRIEIAKDLVSLYRYPDEHPVDYDGFVPPHRLSLFNDGDMVYFNLEISHTLIDGGSMALILRDLAAAYTQQLSPGPAYRDYIAVLQGQSTAATLQFWKTYLDGLKPVFFPGLLDAHEPSRELRVVDIPISPRMVADLHTFTKQHELTLANIFQAVWAVVLRAYTSECDVVFGYLSSGRDVEAVDLDMENAVGAFITMLACRATVDDDLTLLDITQKMHDDFLNSLPYQQTSLAQVQHAMKLSGERLFNSIISLQRPMVEENSSNAVSIEYLGGRDPTEYDLSANITISDAAIAVSINYWSNFMSDNDAERLSSTFSTILSILLEKPCKPIRQLDLLGESHRRYILGVNQEGTVPETNHGCLHNLVHQQAQMNPEAAAIHSWDTTMSYAELDRLSSDLATHLIAIGVALEDAVPLCFDKSAWTVVSMLAVLKAGGAYVSMSPSHPRQHLASIISQTKAKIILAGSQEYAEKVGDLVKQTVVVDSSLFRKLPDCPYSASNLPRVSPDNAAMINFTSGSTGKPKGIVILHKGMCSLVAHNPDMGIDRFSRMLQFSAYTFDTSNSEIFITLSLGGCVCIPSEEDRLNNLAGSMNDLRVTNAFLTPSVALFLSPETLPTLRTLGLVGEAVSSTIARKWQDKVHLINSYGPAECSVMSSLAVLRDGVAPANIGHGHGCLMWVVEPENSQRLVPVGCVGELLIEGPLVSRGYLDPELTARVFIAPPKWRRGAAPGARLYKTGDLVKYVPDGSLVYVGRKDSQVKLNGQRVEMGEVETTISSDVLVQQCVVLLPTAGPCQKKLVAVVVLQGLAEDEATSPELVLLPLAEEHRLSAYNQVSIVKERLTAMLPSYMVPSVWLVSPRLPSTISRKLDRPAISKWVERLDHEAYIRSSVEKEFESHDDAEVAPSLSETEHSLQESIARVLNLPTSEVSVKRSFLSLGGDSITAMQLVVHCRNEGVRILFKDVMQSSSITALAQCAASVDRRSSPTANTVQWNMPFALTPIQQLYFQEISQGSTEPSANQFNQSFLLRLTRNLPVEQLQTAFDQIVQRHSMLHARFQQSLPGEWTQTLPTFDRESYRLREHRIEHEGQAMDIAFRAQRDLDIEHGPVFAVEVFTVHGEASVLFLVAHHLVIDMVSWRIIFQELEDRLSEKGQASYDVPMSFQQWETIQADYVSRHIPPKTALPYDIPPADYEYWGMKEVPNLQADTIQLDTALTREETDRLLTHAHYSMRTEPLDVLIAALVSSFTQTFARNAPPVFNEGHGRQPAMDGPLVDIDLSLSVGWFTTIFPFHIPISPEDTAIQLVRAVKDQRKELPGNGWSYFAGKYLNDGCAREFASHMPVEILFNYLGLYQGLERADGLFEHIPFNKGDVGPHVRRYTLFEINVYVVNGCAHITFAFNRKMKHGDRIHSWLGNYAKKLRDLSQQLATADVVLTRSDYPLLSIPYSRLDQFSTEQLPRMGYTVDDVEDMYPCSPLQEGILLSQVRAAGMYLYHAIMRMDTCRGGPVEPQRLISAWNEVVHRHPMLRTVFLHRLSTRPFDQMVLRAHKPRCLLLEDAPSDQAACDVLNAIQSPAFALDKPPHALTVIRSASGSTYFRLDINHVLMDGTAMAVLVHDLAAAYLQKLRLTGATSYSQYIEHIQSQPAEDSLNFWASHLGEVEPCIFPSLAEPRISDSVQESRQVDVGVPPVMQVRQFCQQHQVTLANMIRLAWGLVLATYTGSDQVCFGYLTAGRELPIPGIESAVGPFINMLVSAMDVARQGTILEELRRLQSEYLSLLPHQHVSLAEIQHRVGRGSEALFNTVVSLQRRDLDSLVLEDLRMEYVDGQDPTEYDMTVNVSDNDREFTIQLGYLTSRISPQQADHVSEALSTAISSIISSPNSNLDSIDLFGPRHRQQVWKWNSSCPATVDECLHTWFERNTRLTPDAPAISSWDGDLTYAQLDKKATQLAQVLISSGIGPGNLIPICFDKCSWAIVAMLGILKAGAGFVPLDPAHPPDRLASVIGQTSAPLALVAMELSKLVVHLVPKIMVISPSSSIWLSDLGQIGDPDAPPLPDDVAYTLFTSGSTGTPKGVVIEHSAASTSVIHHGREIGCSAATRMFQFAAFTFDACILEIFTTLTYGGCICIPSESERMSDIAGSIRRLKANTSFLTPSVVRILRPEHVPSLTTLILGGEALDRDNIQTWGGRLRLMNGYGPTETCVFCVMHTFCGGNDRHNILGRAVSSASWIVRPGNHHQLVPIGAVGELMVQGGTLARGYLGDDLKTRKVFVTDPAFFTPTSEGHRHRFYKTGDLVRYNTDGTIIYLGRKDTQVKLRGQRIELAEIEYQIQRLLPPDFQVAVEVIAPHAEKEQSLLAAFVSQQGQGLMMDRDFLAEMTVEDRAQLIQTKASLANVLPLYMQPSLYIPANWIPTNSAKKLDRQLLRHRGETLSDAQLKMYSLLEDSRRVPSTALERQVQEIWHRVLKLPLEQVRADDNFFQVGGDSIAAMKIAAMTAEDLPVTVADIFRYPILSDLATALATRNKPHTPNAIQVGAFQLVPGPLTIPALVEEISAEHGIPVSAIEDAYPSTPLQEGMMALTMLSPGAYVLRRVIQLGPSIDIDRFRSSWEAVSQNNPIMRTRLVQTTNHGLLQVVLKEQIEWRSTQSLAKYMDGDTPQIMAYGAPLLRYGITGDRYFIWTVHHAIYDGWALPLLLDQVKSSYENTSLQESPPFSSYIKYLQTIEVEATQTFWEEQLAGPRPSTFPILPSPTYRPCVRTSTRRNIPLPSSTHSRIPKATVLRAAWALLLSAYTDSQDVVFGATLSGRNSPVPNIDRIIGPTITTVPIRVRIRPELTVSAFLDQIHQQATEMIPHEHFGLRHIAGISRSCAAAIEFQNLFVVQPASETHTTDTLLPGCQEVDLPLAEFDSYPLVVECSLGKREVHIEARHDESILSGWQVENMLYQLEHSLNQLMVTGSGNQKLSDMEIFGQGDRAQIMRWNSQYPEVVESTVPQVFAQQVLQRPDALAVDSWDGQLTYRELDHLSTTLARHLTTLGVRPEILVPLCFDKSRWAVVAQMAVMKAGGACVNLDPAHPQARLESIVRDSQAPILICAPQHSGILGSSIAIQEVAVAEEYIRRLDSPLETADINPPTLTPRNAAYVLFTSGSTGKPKGIVIEHGSLCSSSKAHGSRWRIGPETRLLQFAAYTFDVSCADIFTTLQRGGCICIPSEHDRLNALSHAINHFRCNWAFLTPTVASLLPADDIPSLKTLVLGGEASTWDTIRKWHDVLDLIVCYGPAECSIYCSGAPPATATSDPANLGAAIGALYWIADPQDPSRLTPVGLVGELLLEGPTVARGYLDDVERTAAAFVQDPVWAPTPDNNRPRVFYRTGDLVRYNEDGTIRFVGRKDTQVKVRGQRVELGEIEQAIRRAMATLAHVTVDAIVDPKLHRQIVVAFLHFKHHSGRAEVMDMTPELRDQLLRLQQTLRESLPSYMIPAMFIPLARVPLTMNGKADRRQLRDLALTLFAAEVQTFSLAEENKQEPTTSEEVELRELWAKVLRVAPESIGARDHFLRSGGDSILAMKLVGLVRARGWHLSVQDIFQTPVLADMAVHITALSQQTREHVSSIACEPLSLTLHGSKPGFVTTVAGDVNTTVANILDILPTTDFQASAVAHGQLKTRGLLNYLVLNGLGPLPWGMEFVQEAWGRFLATHQILRTVFTAHDDRFYQVVLRTIPQDIEMYETDADMDKFCSGLYEKDIAAAFQADSSPTKLIVVSSHECHRLVIRLSHAQYDGVSLPRIWQSFQDVFSRRLPTPEDPFAHYLEVINPRQHDNSSENYWQSLLAGSTMTNVVAHSKPEYRNIYDTHLARTIPVSTTSLSRSGITFATILKAAWSIVLSSLAGTTDVAFGHVVSGRNNALESIERIVGPCLNIIPVRVLLDQALTVSQLLDTLQSQHVASMSHESMGMRDIIRRCSPWASYTRFSSIVQHQNIEQISAVTLDGRQYTISDFCPAADEADIAIKTTPVSQDHMEVLLITSSRSVGKTLASTLLDHLCATIQTICAPGTAKLDLLLSQLKPHQPIIPVPCPLPTVQGPIGANGRNGSNQEAIKALIPAISETWKCVLGTADLTLSLESDFYAVGGDLVATALLAAMWRRQGYRVAAEDLIDHSNVGGMASVLLDCRN